MLKTASRAQFSANGSTPQHQSALMYNYHAYSLYDPNVYFNELGSSPYPGPRYRPSLPLYTQGKILSIPKYFTAGLLPLEDQFHSNISGLPSVNPAVDDRADASMRDESLRRLLSLHRAYYDLSSNTFCKAVCIVDAFITRVKVKPKYMMILAMACYYIASKFDRNNQMVPTMESLVRIADCGGSKSDLAKMVEIVLTKLGTSLISAIGSSSATLLDFLSALLIDANGGLIDVKLPTYLFREAENALCSTNSAQFRPSCLALALLVSCKQVCPPVGINDAESPAFKLLERLELADLRSIADFCNISWEDVEACSRTLYEGGVLESYSPTKSSVPLSRIMWSLTKRKRLSISVTAAPTLKTISEGGEGETEE